MGLYLRLNTTGQMFTGANKLQLPAVGDRPLVTQEFSSADVVLDFGATDITFAIGGFIQISGGVRFSKKPNGTIDIALIGATVAIDVDSAGTVRGQRRHQPQRLRQLLARRARRASSSSRSRSTVSACSATARRRRQQRRRGSSRPPTSSRHTPARSWHAARSTARATSTSSSTTSTTSASTPTSITDDPSEFDLFINGQAASTFGITVNGHATPVPGLKNVYRYTITGAIPDAGEISVRFISGTFWDMGAGANRATNAPETEYFTLVNPLANGTLPPAGPVGQLANPISGSSISLTQINGQRYIDVTFVSRRSGAAIDENSINGDEFTLSGAITNDLILMPGTGGIPDIIGQPLRIGTNTWRYYLNVRKPVVPVGTPAGTPAPTAAPFTTGDVIVTFRARQLQDRRRRAQRRAP